MGLFSRDTRLGKPVIFKGKTLTVAQSGTTLGKQNEVLRGKKAHRKNDVP